MSKGAKTCMHNSTYLMIRLPKIQKETHIHIQGRNYIKIVRKILMQSLPLLKFSEAKL